MESFLLAPLTHHSITFSDLNFIVTLTVHDIFQEQAAF
jgi:hypothetical protein